MRDLLDWICILLVFGGIVVTGFGAIIVKFSRILGFKDSTVWKWLLVTLIGAAMIAGGLVGIRYLPPTHHSAPQDIESDSSS